MKRIITFLVCAICLTINAFAARQAVTELIGAVVDATGAPLGFATVYLTNPDGAVVCGTSADADGRFELKAAQGTYSLTVSLVGYRDAVQTVTLNQPRQELSPVRLEEDTQLLGEAVVQAVMPKTKLTGEGLATSVHGSVLENAGTANDVLSKVPGLIKGQDGLEVIGKGAPQIYVNGRKLTDPTELDRILSHEIQSVEVINNPGAQYDATVRAVVRIRTVKRKGEGFGFNVNLTDEQSLRVKKFNDPDAAVNVNYRTGGVDLFGGVKYNQFNQRQNSDLVQETNLNPVIRQVETLTGDFSNQSLTANGGVNWQIANNHSAGFKVEWGRSLDYNDYELMEGDVFRGSELMDHLKTVNRGQNGPRAPQSLGTNVYYNGLVGKMGIDLNLDYFQISDNKISNIQEDSDIQDATVSTESGSDSKLYAAKLVLSYPVWMGQLQVGTEEAFSRNRDNYRLTGAEIPSTSSRVKEDNAAAFVNYGFVVGQIGQLNAGLRYEHVNYAYEDLMGDGSFSRKYDNLFPSVSFAGVFGPVQTMLSYSARTARPSFNMLSTAIRYNNRYTLQGGNPAIQPQAIQSLSATALWNFLSLSVSYDRTKDPIITWANLYNDEGVILLKPVNGENPLRSLTAYLVATPTIGPWNISAVTGLLKTWLQVGDLHFNDAPVWIAQLNNTLTLNKGWQLELGGEYHSPGQQQNMTLTNHYFNLTAAVQKTLLKDGSLVLRLEGRDLTYSGHNHVFTNLGHYSITQSVLMDTQRLVFSIRYRFNTTESKYKGTGAGKDARQRMGNSSN
ncbi:MAG: outer membrane beta-barrel protein [Bacteroidales bacterium]|nr:outer membrane beta-barrel protein [Bacteroidales bacterium]